MDRWKSWGRWQAITGAKQLAIRYQPPTRRWLAVLAASAIGSGTCSKTSVAISTSYTPVSSGTKRTLSVSAARAIAAGWDGVPPPPPGPASRADVARQPAETDAEIGHAKWGLRHPCGERLPVGKTLQILLNEQAIEQPHGIAVEADTRPSICRGSAHGPATAHPSAARAAAERGSPGSARDAEEIAGTRFFEVFADEWSHERVEFNHAGLPMWRWPARWALAGLLRLDEQRLGTFARLAIGSQVERIEGEIGLVAGGGRAALDRHEATGLQQLLEVVGVIEPVMALAHAGQAHVLFAKGTRQQLDHGPDPEALGKGG